jgi:hypothetical protein
MMDLVDKSNFDSFAKSVIELAQGKLDGHLDSQTELEYRLLRSVDSRVIHSLLLVQFKNIIEHLATKFKPVEETSLDITIDDPSIKSKIRLSISGVNEIKTFCASDDISKIKSKSYMIKEKDQTVDVNDYLLRIQASKEQPLNDQQMITGFNHSMNKNNKFYRYKHRYSFTDQELGFRYDLTVIKSDKGRTFRDSRTLQRDETYEVEVEHLAVTEDDTIETLMTEKRLYAIYDLIRWSQDSFAVITMNDQNLIMNAYHKLVFGDSKQETKFVGLNVMPLTKSKIAVLQSERYAVTEKADGERYLLLIHDTKFYLINNRMQIKYTGLQLINNDLSGSLFDGELVGLKTSPEIKDKNYKYLIFDCFFLKGKDQRGFSLDERIKLMEQTYKKFTVNNPNLQIGLKTYFKETANMSLAKYCDLVYSTPYPYELDGIVLTPVSTPYSKIDTKNSKGQMIEILKWKPLDQLSIDFGVELLDHFPRIDPLLKQNIVRAKLKVSQGQRWEDFLPKDGGSDFNIIKLSVDETDQRPHSRDGNIIFNNSVVEFIYKPNDDLNWIPIRFRPDKTTIHRPNAYHTASSTWELINDPIVSIKKLDELMMTPPSTVLIEDENIKTYYANEQRGDIIKPIKDYHNSIKYYLFQQIIGNMRRGKKDRVISLLDPACGQLGDLGKWTSSRINHVVGLNLYENDFSKVGGARDRIKFKDSTQYLHDIVLIWADSRLPILTGKAGLDPANQILLRNTIKRSESFDLISCQFAFHYFTESQVVLNQFLLNVSQNLHIGGYFFGTTWDGNQIFQALKETPLDGQIEGKLGDQVIWRIVKKYNDQTLELVGQKIGVANISINQVKFEIDEYLVNFDHVVATAVKYGLKITKVGSLTGFESFEDLHERVVESISQEKMKKNINKLCGKGYEDEQKFSFWNKYFIFQKTGEISKSVLEQHSKIEPLSISPAPTMIEIPKVTLKKKPTPPPISTSLELKMLPEPIQTSIPTPNPPPMIQPLELELLPEPPLPNPPQPTTKKVLRKKTPH